jgi:hypothetical protein
VGVTSLAGFECNAGNAENDQSSTKKIVPEGLRDRSPTPLSDSTELAEVLRRNRRMWLHKSLAVGRAVGSELNGAARNS